MRKLKNDELDRLTLEEFKTTEKLPLVLILDNVRSMNNVGSAFRTSDAFAIEKVYLCGITAQPPHREINKTALGATESVDWEHAENTTTLCKNLQQKGYKVLAVEQADNSTSLENFKIEKDQKYALVFGNEVFGVEDEVIEAADACLEIPQFGTKHSLNISVSIGVVLWDLTSKIKFG
ncbi:RNA methyltransferase [Roseivirga echinicomitans]|uniref:RNA methyltransferase n=1 Tax=Roseivirga echinicomitans TaxID=296218 RepID=A0A150XYC0_9BACT|nr:RNA methyltransferase [Roseivirga echinicomitans]KYG83757.1 RNA methyltransferase [Roseivirga echinicomitans]